MNRGYVLESHMLVVVVMLLSLRDSHMHKCICPYSPFDWSLEAALCIAMCPCCGCKCILSHDWCILIFGRETILEGFERQPLLQQQKVEWRDQGNSQLNPVYIWYIFIIHVSFVCIRVKDKPPIYSYISHVVGFELCFILTFLSLHCNCHPFHHKYNWY